jgi:hypothetical protein
VPILSTIAGADENALIVTFLLFRFKCTGFEQIIVYLVYYEDAMMNNLLTPEREREALPGNRESHSRLENKSNKPIFEASKT